MLHRLSFFLPLTLFVTAVAEAAPASSELEREYQQVRKIALRDPQVRAAYEKADRRLAEKIVELDPALKNYAGPRSTAVTQTRPARVKQPVTRTHLVKKGDTLASIARQYGVTVADLHRLNRVSDERKLSVGQLLRIEIARR